MKRNTLKVVDSNPKSTAEIKQELAEIISQHDVHFSLNGQNVRELLLLTQGADFAEALKVVGLSTQLRASSTNFDCDKLNLKLATPCDLSGCRFNVNYPQSDNCLLAHAQRHDAQSFAQSEISYLTKLHPSAVSKLLTKALNKLRKVAVDQAIEDQDLVPDFVLQASEATCVVCESLIFEQSDVFYQEHDRVWCSEACLEEQQPTEIALECMYGMPVPDLVVWLVRRFGTWDCEDYLIEQMAQAVKVDFDAFKLIFTKVRDLIMTKTTKPQTTLTPIGDRRKLRRLQKLPTMHAPLQGSLTKQHGASDIDRETFDAVAREFELLLAS